MMMMIYVICNNDSMLSATHDEEEARAEVERLKSTQTDERFYYHYRGVRTVSKDQKPADNTAPRSSDCYAAIDAAEKALDDANYWGNEPDRGAIRRVIIEAKLLAIQIDREDKLKGDFEPQRVEVVVRNPIAKDMLERLCAVWHTWIPNSCYIDGESSV